jgi:hypothetical protein
VLEAGPVSSGWHIARLGNGGGAFAFLGRVDEFAGTVYGIHYALYSILC